MISLSNKLVMCIGSVFGKGIVEEIYYVVVKLTDKVCRQSIPIVPIDTFFKYTSCVYWILLISH